MDHIRKALRLAFCIVVCIHVGNLAAARGEVAICHALRDDSGSALSQNCSHVPYYFAEVELVVAGPIVRADKETEGPGLFDVDVERVCIGKTGEKRLRFEANFDAADKLALVGLRASGPGAATPFMARYSWTAENLDAQLAVVRAAFDEVVLAADVIYAGRPLPSTDEQILDIIREKYPDLSWGDLEGPRKIDVDRVIAGDAIPQGTEVLANGEDRHGQLLTVGPAKAWLFLAHRSRSPFPGVPLLSPKTTVYPLELEDDIRAALARREKYPLYDAVDDDGLAYKVREIVFLGTVDEAISMLASKYHQVAMFGARRLVTLGSESTAPIARRIEQNLTRPALDDGDLRAQEILIRVLAILAAKHEDSRSVYFGLLDKLLTAIRAGTEPPVWRVEFAASQFDEIHAPPTANHSLAWLIESASEPMSWQKDFHNRFVMPGDFIQGAANPLDGEFQDRFADRLCRLRDVSDGVWRQELQLALDLGGIDDRRELAEVAKAGATLKRIESEPITDLAGSQAIAWSSDGKLLATHGQNRMRIWNTADRSVIRSWPLVGDIEAMVFANDGKSLFIAGGQKLPAGVAGWSRQVLQRVDAQTGETLRDFAGNRSGSWSTIALSAAQDVMVSSAFGEVAVWKLPEGKLLRHVEAGQGTLAALSPDGKTLWRSLGGRGSLIEDLLGERKPAIRCESNDAIFSPAGRLFTLEHVGAVPGETAGTPKWFERRTEGDFALLPEAEGQAGAEAGGLCIPRLSEEGIAQLVSLPGEHEVAQFKVSNWYLGSLSALALSPDGTILAVGGDYRPVRFYRVPSGERLRLPGPTHLDDLADLWFSTDGKVLHSVGYDELTVEWDAETLKPLGVWPIDPRKASDIEREQPFRRSTEPYRLNDGRSLQFQFPINGDSLKLPISITDAAGGNVIKQREVDIPWKMTGDAQGLVPWEKYFYLETQIYDLESLELVAGRRLPGWYVGSVAFAPDGSRYAIAAGTYRSGGVVVCLRVLETLSSKTLWYTEPKAASIQYLVFSPDGKKLAWYDGSSIQVQQLP